MQQHRSVTDDPAVQGVAKAHLDQVRRNRTLYLLPSCPPIRGALDHAMQPDANKHITRAVHTEKRRWSADRLRWLAQGIDALQIGRASRRERRAVTVARGSASTRN